MKVYSWNVNGVRAVLNKSTFLEFVKEHQPDVLCLQETKANRDQVEIDLPKYHEYWNSAQKKGYSGTAIFTKIKPIKVTHDFPPAITQKYLKPDSYGNIAEEGRVITAEFEKYFVVTVYTPNSKGDLSRLELRQKHWDPAFLKYCEFLQSQKPVIICGDLNVAHTEDDLANPKPNIGKHGFTYEERKGFDNFLGTGFVDTFRIFTKGNGNYSWWTHWANARARNIGWRIDYLLVSASIASKVKSATIHPDILGSDHCPVSIEIDL